MNQQEKLILNYPLFDGEKVMESASVVVENGTITTVNENASTDRDYLLMPGLLVLVKERPDKRNHGYHKYQTGMD